MVGLAPRRTRQRRERNAAADDHLFECAHTARAANSIVGDRHRVIRRDHDRFHPIGVIPPRVEQRQGADHLIACARVVDARQHFGAGKRRSIVGIGAQARFGAVAKAVKIAVLVKAEKGHRPSRCRGALKAFAAVAQPIGVDIPPIGGGEGMFAPERFTGEIGGPPRGLTPTGGVGAIFWRPDRDDRPRSVGLMGEVASQHLQNRLLAPSGDEIAVNRLVTVSGAIFQGNQQPGIGGILIEEFVNAIGEIFHHDAHGATQINCLHLL